MSRTTPIRLSSSFMGFPLGGCLWDISWRYLVGGMVAPVYRLQPKPRKGAARLPPDSRVGRRDLRSGSARRCVVSKNIAAQRNIALVYNRGIATPEDSMITRRNLVLSALLLAAEAPLA